MKCVVLRLLICGVVCENSASGRESYDQTADEAAIRKMEADYVQVFNKHDAKALAELCSPNAIFVNRMIGQEVVGRAAIAEQLRPRRWLAAGNRANRGRPRALLCHGN